MLRLIVERKQFQCTELISSICMCLWRGFKGGAGRAPLCDHFHDDWDVQRKYLWIRMFATL